MTAGGNGYEVDERHFPLIHVNYLRGMSDPEFDLLLDHYSLMLRERPRRYALVVETHHSEIVPLGQAQRQAAWMKTNVVAVREKTVCIAMVVHSPVLRGVVRTLLAIQPIAVPHAIFTEATLAKQWAAVQLRQDDVARGLA